MTREDTALSLAQERHDTRRCDICGEKYDRAGLHDGVCDWCSNANAAMDEEEGL